MTALNTNNLEYITWQYEQLQFAILGGFKIEGLDRMRITLKIQWKQLTIRHNLDLYNEAAVDKLIKRCAERFSLGTVYLVKAFEELINTLEGYRLDKLKSQELRRMEKRALTQAEKAAAIDFLKKPDLLQATSDLIGKSGVIGEENNRLLMYLIFTSRKTAQHLHIISLGSSGTGKSHLQEKVGELIPQEDKIEITTLSENAFYYFGKQELKHKLILIEDLDGAEGVLYPLRELQSKKVITKSIAIKTNTGETQTVHLRVEGPVSVAGCTTRESIYEDNANRSFLIYLDESREQDAGIMEYQRKKSAGKVNTAAETQVKQFFQNVQRILYPVTVRNPYAEHLVLPESVFKPRRTNAHYLAFIEAITFYHQFQREQKTNKATGEVYIESTLEDIAAANNLMKEILLRKSDDLSGAYRNYFEALTGYLQDKGQVNFTNQQSSLLGAKTLATITDRKTAVPLPANSSLISYYMAEAANAQEYTPFEQRTLGRLFTVGSGVNAMYVFNGKEKDNEVSGEWNAYDYGIRMEFVPYTIYKRNTPGRILLYNSLKTAQDVQQKWEGSRIGRLTNGLVNTTFGAVGAVASVTYISETGGVGAASDKIREGQKLSYTNEITEKLKTHRI